MKTGTDFIVIDWNISQQLVQRERLSNYIILNSTSLTSPLGIVKRLNFSTFFPRRQKDDIHVKSTGLDIFSPRYLSLDQVAKRRYSSKSLIAWTFPYMSNEGSGKNRSRHYSWPLLVPRYRKTNQFFMPSLRKMSILLTYWTSKALLENDMLRI